MDSHVTTSSWVNVGADATIRYQIDHEVADFRLGEAPTDFEIGFHVDALREFLRLGAEAVRSIDADQADQNPDIVS